MTCVYISYTTCVLCSAFLIDISPACVIIAAGVLLAGVVAHRRFYAPFHFSLYTLSWLLSSCDGCTRILCVYIHYAYSHVCVLTGNPNTRSADRRYAVKWIWNKNPVSVVALLQAYMYMLWWVILLLWFSKRLRPPQRHDFVTIKCIFRAVRWYGMCK